MVNKNYTIEMISEEVVGVSPIMLENTGVNELLSTKGKVKVNILALGDVGTNVLMGLKLMGGDVISEIGIFDLNQNQLKRLEMEFNQMNYPLPELAPSMPTVKILEEDELSDCDVFIFCATKGVPELGTSGDVRMMQLEANLGLVTAIGEKLKKRNYNGLICVVSDPVDQLCMGMLKASGVSPGQVRGFGLGVMAARARYFANRDERFTSYLTEGRAFGPHGEDLVIANSLVNYDDEISRELTALTVKANLKVRELGYKPFLAPAISSAAISILLTLRGEWNYGSCFVGEFEKQEGEEPVVKGAYLGMLSRFTTAGVQWEDVNLPEELYNRIKKSYQRLI